MSFVLEYIDYPLENAPNLILVFYWVAYDCPWKFLFQSDPNVGTHVSIKSHEVEGPSKHMRFFRGGITSGSIKTHEIFGSIKTQEISGGERSIKKQSDKTEFLSVSYFKHKNDSSGPLVLLLENSQNVPNGD